MSHPDTPSLDDWMGASEISRLSRADVADLEVAIEAALAGGREVMRRYRGREPMEVDEKGPDDPVTTADREADRAIVRVLGDRRPGEPVRSEESGVELGDAEEGELGAGHLWVVDPLDGTKEFLARNGEFAVMVGLAVAGGARLGVVYRPDPGILYFGTAAGGAWAARVREGRRREEEEDGSSAGDGPDARRREDASPSDRAGGRLGDPAAGPDRPPASMRETGPRDARDGGDGDGDGGDRGEPEVRDLDDFGDPVPLSLEAAPDGAVRIIHSRSHTPEGLDRVAEALGETELVPSGSAGLKCALIAAGEADLYVHPVPYLKEWDTCAPDAVLRGAGGRVTDCLGRPLRYGKPERAQLGGLFAGRPEVWDRAEEAVRALAPEEAAGG